MLLAMHPKVGFGNQHASFRVAVHYLRRVMALRSLEELDPELVALASLFLASKVCEVRWPRGMHGSLQYRGFEMSKLLRAAAESWDVPRQVDALDVLVYERVVLETMSFSLIVHPPPHVTGHPEMEAAEAWLLVRGDSCLSLDPVAMASAVESHKALRSSNKYEMPPAGLDDAARERLAVLRAAFQERHAGSAMEVVRNVNSPADHARDMNARRGFDSSESDEEF